MIQWYCINIPEYVHTIAAQAIMRLFNWKLIKYINKSRETLFFFLFPTAVIETVYLNFPLFYSVSVFLRLIVSTLKTLLACPIWHVASQISLSLFLLHHHFFSP